MSGPNQTALHIDQLLTNLSLQVLQNPEGFVAGKVFPDVPVAKQSDKYAVIPQDDFLRDDMQLRADATESSGSGWKTSQDNYYCDVYAHHTDIGRQAQANADAQFQVRENTTKFLTHKALIKKERLFVEKAFKTGVWTTERAGVSGSPVAGTSVKQWNDPVSTPIEDIDEVKLAMQIKTGGYRPNLMVMPRTVYNVLKEHPDIQVRIRNGAQAGAPGTGYAHITEGMLAALFEVDELLIMDKVFNTAGENLPAVNEFFVDKAVLLTYREGTGLGMANAGINFSWTGLAGENANMSTTIKTIPMPLKDDATRVEIQMAFDTKITAPDLGVYFSAIIA